MPLAGERVRASDIIGRTGCRVRRAANQSIASATATSMSWDTEDEDTNGFISVTSTTITIPTGLDGLYAITAELNCAGISGNGGGIIVVPTSGITGIPTDFLTPLDPTRDRGAIGITVPLLAGDSFVVQAFHATGAAVNFTGYCTCYRVAPGS
jgi:hypothetical protein